LQRCRKIFESDKIMSTTEITGLDLRSGRPLRLTIENGLIARLEPAESDTDLHLSAGFIDLQVNGYIGFDLNSEQISIDTVLGLVEAMLSNGVTSFVPTLITAPEERICHGLNVIADARRSDRRAAACIPFVHVEGPHISPIDGYRGAHPAEFVRPPSISEFNRWQKAAGGIVGMITLSPHFSESEEYIAALVKQGVHIAIGHTHAPPEQIARAVEAGARLSTHLGNGIAQEIPRHRNPIWSQLADDRLTATFIADGHHLPKEVLSAMLRAKGIQRSVLVSDSVALAGMPAGTYDTPVGGQVELHRDGRLCVLGSELLAGSTASLAQCIGQVVRMTGMPLNDALIMATANPGRFAGGRGLLAPGSRADLVRFRWTDEVVIEDVWLAGERVLPSQTAGPYPRR
jgi:N-acetylglucosamine-6-phosphate deacetylase